MGGSLYGRELESRLFVRCRVPRPCIISFLRITCDCFAPVQIHTHNYSSCLKYCRSAISAKQSARYARWTDPARISRLWIAPRHLTHHRTFQSQFTLLDAAELSVSEPDASQPTVCEYIVNVLATSLGIKHAFGCPGDFAFAFDDAIEDHPEMEFVLTTNELNAAYAADAYARQHGASVLTTTYGVGELSALNGVMGAKAERVGAVFHLVGEPGLRLQHTGRVVHHTLGAQLHPATSPFFDISSSGCCASLRVRDPGSLPRELDTVIEVGLRERQPVYILVPKDVGVMRIPETTYRSIFDHPIPRSSLRSICHASSVVRELEHGVEAVVKRLSEAKNVAVLVSYMINRLGLEDQAIALIEKLGCPFFTTTMDKGTLSEQHPLYGGMYKGKISQSVVLDVVEQADCVLDVGGVLFDDLSTGFGTSNLLKEKVVTLNAADSAICLGHASERCVQNLRVSYHGVFIGDAIDKILASDVGPFPPSQPQPSPPCWPSVEASDSSERGITYGAILSVFQDALRANDTFVVEVGTISGLMTSVRLPEGVKMISQTLWGSIGAATPMALGAALANGTSSSDGRTLLVTGDGAHLMTACEIGSFGRVGVKPMIVVINNGVYGVEEFLEKNECRSYNNLTGWDYAAAAKAMLGKAGESWIIESVDTTDALADALKRARDEDRACYIDAHLEEKLLDPMSSVDLEIMYFDQPPK